jgi:hypothetical protein
MESPEFVEVDKRRRLDLILFGKKRVVVPTRMPRNWSVAGIPRKIGGGIVTLNTD